ncbi:MAG: hypothetical protein OEX19_03145 [Gammaproteobacteria bacterium]|nr:hypothetical protein [Gammaproteobacteria bacterium]
MKTHKYLIAGLYLAVCTLIPLYADAAEIQKSGKAPSLEEKIMSCGELLEQIQASDCGNHIVNLFRGGHVALGVASYSLSTQPRLDDKGARFNGDIHVTPYLSINTRLSFIEGSEFGYDFSFGLEQAHALNQTIVRKNKSKTVDLNTFAIANTFSTEASLFYSYGAQDSTPRRYALIGVGFGIGYADVVGKSYMTEVNETNNAACYQAGQDLIDGSSVSTSNLTNACELDSFRRLGFGISGRINIDFRYDNFFLTFDTKMIQLSSGNSLSLGTSGMKLNPSIYAITISYIYNI